MGVVKGSIFGSRDLHFRIPRPIFGSGANFQLNLMSFNFIRILDPPRRLEGVAPGWGR